MVQSKKASMISKIWIPFIFWALVKTFKLNLPLWLYIEHFFFLGEALMPGWTGYFLNLVSIKTYMLYVYVRGYVYALKHNKKNKKDKDVDRNSK